MKRVFLVLCLLVSRLGMALSPFPAKPIPGGTLWIGGSSHNQLVLYPGPTPESSDPYLYQIQIPNETNLFYPLSIVCSPDGSFTYVAGSLGNAVGSSLGVISINNTNTSASVTNVASVGIYGGSSISLAISSDSSTLALSDYGANTIYLLLSSNLSSSSTLCEDPSPAVFLPPTVLPSTLPPNGNFLALDQSFQTLTVYSGVPESGSILDISTLDLPNLPDSALFEYVSNPRQVQDTDQNVWFAVDLSANVNYFTTVYLNPSNLTFSVKRNGSLLAPKGLPSTTNTPAQPGPLILNSGTQITYGPNLNGTEIFAVDAKGVTQWTVGTNYSDAFQVLLQGDTLFVGAPASIGTISLSQAPPISQTPPTITTLYNGSCTCFAIQPSSASPVSKRYTSRY